MNKTKTKKLIIIWAVVFNLVISVPVFAVIYANTTDDAFVILEQSSSASADGVKGDSSMAELIIRGAGYFLQAGAEINRLSERYEMTEIEGFDYYGMYNAASKAISNLEKMDYYYGQLITKADNTPYNLTVINSLTSFDYDLFGKSNGLNKDVFDQAKEYLSAGDVRGAYKKIKQDANNLLNRLHNIRWLIYWGYLPDSTEMMDLKQQLLNTDFFGQYLTRVFNEIK
jgi:hypothetical protein